MATYSLNYMDVWKWLQFDGTDTWVLYWDDFNPADQSNYDANHCTVYQATSNFNLSWFQPWHEVGACAWEIRRDWPWSSLSQTVRMDFKRNGTRVRKKQYSINWSSITSDQYSWWRWWCYFWIDKDEIWAWGTNYEIEIYPTDWTRWPYTKSFTVSNLSIDSSYHPSWYLWIDGVNLCYTDNTGDEVWMNGYWFKHRIAYDSSYSTNVWSSNKWFMWLDDSDLLRIYYVDEFWNRRRTYPSRFMPTYPNDDPATTSSSNKWYMWVWVYDMYEWYGHLCFVAPNWSIRRILNWPPAWYV